MSLRQMEEDDSGFKDDLIESHEYVWMIARWLNARGHNAVVRALRIREKIEEMDEFADQGDLEIMQRIEVKRRLFEFSSIKTYPHPTAIVDVCHTWDKARPKPYAYFILNKGATCFLLIKGATSKHWKRETFYDKTKKRERTCYFCPLEHVSFHKL